MKTESQLIHYIPAALKSSIVNTAVFVVVVVPTCNFSIKNSIAMTRAKSPRTISIHQVAPRPWQCTDRISPIKPKKRKTCDRKQHRRLFNYRQLLPTKCVYMYCVLCLCNVCTAIQHYRTSQPPHTIYT